MNPTKTTYEAIGPDGCVWQTCDADAAEEWARAGFRVTAETRRVGR